MSNEITDATIFENINKQKWTSRPMENAFMLQTRFTTYTSWYLSLQGRRCGVFEQQWVDCASQTGKKIGYLEKCKDEYDDLNECTRNIKTFKRYTRMQEERQKHGIVYQKPPPIDTTQDIKYKNTHY